MILHFIQLQVSRDQPSAQEFTTYILLHWAAVHSPDARVSSCEVVVVAMGTVEAAVAVAKHYGPRISCPNHGQPSLPRIYVMGRTYTTSFPASVS